MTDKNNNSYKPDWHPKDAGDEFAIRIVKGVEGKNEGLDLKSQHKKHTHVAKRKQLSSDDYINGVLNNDRTILARTITLIESNSESHQKLAQEVLQQLLPKSGNSIRIGISGVPGAGKSTFIETFGCYLIEKGHKVAVLAIDPSSSVTRGSVLGDKTRMEKLSREQNCFIRPSPSGGTLGGVTRKTRETMLVCEAAGFDVILVETVGVGQNEITVRSMVDFYLLLMIAGAGDELQGIKKGVIEIADALLVNKADGDNLSRAKIARTDYSNALHYLAPATEGWKTDAYICSAITGFGIDNVWEVITKFLDTTKNSGFFDKRRKQQAIEWVFTMVEEELKTRFYSDSRITNLVESINNEVYNEKLLPTRAAQDLLKVYFNE